MEWLPPWLARAYARIYAEKKTEQFEFAEASAILVIQEERRLAKTLARLKASGYLTARRDPVDARRKLFKLIDPVSTTLAYAIQSRAAHMLRINTTTIQRPGALTFRSLPMNFLCG